ncbi:hypothetical protein ACFPH6_20510 [Streptomyces xiangluensis]|uniref:NADH:flavin oxidoreductase/NADH oxidase N-terminal domain-containing protein n=1 Tax=Streptomyces xiangluensis TaxID=2665720 RepID=A0ABV8YRK5_9ACTN
MTNRIRFAVEVASAVADEIGADRTGLRVSPGNSYNDITEHDTHQVYPALLAALASLNLAYLHVIHAGDEDLVARLRREWPTALLLNRAGAPLEARIADLDAGLADVVTVAAAALANPDLPARLQANAPLNAGTRPPSTAATTPDTPTTPPSTRHRSDMAPARDPSRAGRGAT